MATACINGEELWKECASWLTQLDILRSDHRANWQEATIVDLAHTLRDGVLLCTLISKLDPSCIDLKDVNLKPTMAQFLCLKNIQLFLKKCVTDFGLKESDLFEPLMLFDLTNFHKVLCTLSKLSQTPKALKSNILSFSAQNGKTKEEDEIYQSLTSFDLPQRGRKSWNVPHTYAVYSDYNTNEEVYQDLCSIRNVPHLDFTSTQQPQEKRDFVIKELVDTEKNYVEVLAKLKKNFMRPMEQLLKPEDFAKIFCKISELHEIHTGFLSQLLKVNNDPALRLSSVFMTWRDNFVVYGTYCANLTQACSLLQDICDKNEVIREAIANYEKEDNNGKFKLRDVLSVPMQRILKYHLLLEKLIEFTERNHEDYNDLRRAREAMLDVAGFINETARDTEHINVLRKLYENIVDWVEPDYKLEKYGKLLRDGELRIKAHNETKVRNRYVFIFDKCMIVCKQVKSDQFSFRDRLLLSDYRVEVQSTRFVSNSNTRWSYYFYLVKQDLSLAYTLIARTEELKEKFIMSLQEAMDNLRPAALSNTCHKFELHTFDLPTLCTHCSKYLKGQIYQGYKCKVCEVGAHKDCIANSGRCGVQTMQQFTPMHEKLWFAGEIDRNKATSLLSRCKNGTYLVRIRPNNHEDVKYALSLKTDNTVKHMKIFSKMIDNETKYYLSLTKTFDSIEDLIENYQKKSLRENYESLERDTRLEWPYRQLRCIALKNFEPEDRSHLRLRLDCEVIVFAKEGYNDGWWKGRSEDMIGFFPGAYVRVIEEINDC